MKKLMRRSKYLPIIVIFIVFFSIVIPYNLWRDSLMKKHGRFTIAEIVRVKSAARGYKITVRFEYRENVYEIESLNSSGYIKSKDMGKRLFIKFITTHPELLVCYSIEHLVPDSLTYVPIEGWDKEWMEKHFPEFVKYCD